MNSHSLADLSTVNLIFDAILVLAGIFMAVTATRISLAGAVGKTVRSVVWGAIILGLAHLVETVIDMIFNIPVAQNELIHRFIILVGFAFLLVGIKGLADSLSNLRGAPVKR